MFDNDAISHIVGEVAATHPNGGVNFEGDMMPFPWWIGTVGEAISLIGYVTSGRDYTTTQLTRGL